MATAQISHRYASALLELAVEKGVMDQISEDMDALKNIWDEQRDFRNLMLSPVVKPTKKRTIVGKLFADKIQPFSQKYLDMLIRKRRESLLRDIIIAFQEQCDKKRSITRATVTSAVELTEALRAEIKHKISTLPGTRNNIVLEEKVEPSIIGGFIIDVDDVRIDKSVSSQLHDWKQKYNIINSN